MLYETERDKLMAEAQERKHYLFHAGDMEGAIQSGIELKALAALPEDHEHCKRRCLCGESFVGIESIIMAVISAHHRKADGTSEELFETAADHPRHLLIGPCCLQKLDVKGHLFLR